MRFLPSRLSVSLLAVSLGLALSLGAGPGRADGDQDRALEAVRRGEVLPLGDILDRAQDLLGGRMIEAELEREDGRWVYEIVLLGADGRVLEAYFDAATAELLELEGEESGYELGRDREHD